MPADEYLKWEEHFKYHPPSTVGIEKLLAMNIAIKCSSKEKRYSEYDIAPWLINPLVAEEMKRKSEIESVKKVENIYQQIKKDRNNG